MVQFSSSFIINMETVTSDLFYFPEAEPYSFSFMQAGFDSTFMIPGMQTSFYITLGICALVVLHGILVIFKQSVPKVRRVTTKISTYLYWNGLIRFIMEIYLDVGINAILNLQTFYWNTAFTALTFSNILAILFLVILGIAPIFLLIFYAINLVRWNDQEFQGKFNSFIQGTNTNFKKHQWLVLFIPFAFFLRRLLLICTVIFWEKFFWGQIAFQFGVSTMMIIFLQQVRPLESDFVTNMETFNEVSSLFILYLVMSFTDVVDAEMRNMYGKCYIVLICLYIAVHLFFLLQESLYKLRLTIRRKLYERKVKKTRESILTQRRQPYFVEEVKGPAEEADELVVPGSLPIRRRIVKKVKKKEKLIKLD